MEAQDRARRVAAGTNHHIPTLESIVSQESKPQRSRAKTLETFLGVQNQSPKKLVFCVSILRYK
jgi:hypothetical protein